MQPPFAGIRVVDATTGIAGSLAGMMLGDFGADVVGVAPPEGHALRDHPGALFWQRNRRVVTLDVETAAGLADFHLLVATADAVMLDAGPAAAARLGLTNDALCARYPSLVSAWLPPYGTTGRWSDLPGDDLLVSAVTGVADAQYGFRPGPIALVTPQISYAQGLLAAGAIAAGLWERRSSGRGQGLVASGLHAVAAVESGNAVRTPGGAVRAARDSRGGWPSYRLYECGDGGWFFLGTLIAPFFLRALEAIDRLDVMAMEGVNGDFANILQPAIAEPVHQALEATFKTRPRDEWVTLLHNAGVPCAPVGTSEEWFASPTVAANGMRLELEHPSLGTVRMPGLPVQLSETPGSVRGFAQPASLDDVLADAPAPQTPPAPVTAETGGGPLAGVRVLDLGAFIAGTFAPTILASLGADVIKVEPVTGDPFRPFGYLFAGFNLGKRSLAIDMKQPEGRAIFEDLVRSADVVLDNFRLGVRERLGIDMASLQALNPRIISCSITGYGREGPLADYPGFDPLVQARSGIMAAQGGDDAPVFHQIAVNDTGTALVAAFGVLAALHAREATGRGQEVLTSLANQGVLLQSGELTWHAGRALAPAGGRDFRGPSALRRFYACEDGWVAIACTRNAAATLGGTLGIAAAADEAREGPFARAIGTRLAGLTCEDAVTRLTAAGTPVTKVVPFADVFDDPWCQANRWFTTYQDPGFGEMLAARAYVDWSRSGSEFPRSAPAIGEHGLEVLAECGYDDERVAALLGSGVLRI